MSVPKPTEMTVRALLQKELEKRGVKVTPELSFVTPVGRMMPDLVLRNSGNYVVETKLGAEAKLFDALIQLYDYSKYMEAKGAFAILFPEELRRPWPYEMLEKISADPKLSYKVAALFKDLRPTQQFAGNLAQVADWIAEHVLRPPVVEADTSLAIRVLSEAVDFMTASIRQLGGKELEDIFGGETVFENLLQYEKGEYPLEAMRKAAVYLLINQILFYYVLSNVDKYYVPIDETKINRPGDLAGYFKRVLEKDYSATFGFDVASRLPDDATEMVRKAVMVIKALAPQKIGQDVLGKVFHELIPFEIRKAVAAFYTNNEAAEILAQLAIDDPGAKVMDLAVGSGTLLVASYRRKKELLKKIKGDFNFDDHKKFLEDDLTGIDIMPFAAHLAVVHLSLQALIFETERVRIAVWDSTELKPGQDIPAISRELKAAYKRPTLEMFMKGPPSKKGVHITKGTVTLEGMGGEQINLEQADLVIMNPPFTRQERLPVDYKIALAKRFQKYANNLHGQLGLYGYFVFLADRFTRPGGRIALVLPATLLRIRSAKGIRRLLAEKYCIEYIITTWQKAAFSEGAQFREILLVAKKMEVADADRCCIVNLKKVPKNLDEAKAIADKIKAASSEGIEVDNNDMALYFVAQDELRRIENWFTYISTYDPQVLRNFQKITEKAGVKLTPFKCEAQRFDLGHVKKDNVHGFVLRYQSRARKLIDRWYVHQLDANNLVAKDKITTKEVRIPLPALAYGLRSSSGVNTINVSDEADFIITSRFKDINNVCPNVTETVLDKWRRKIKERASNLAIARRFVLSAPGLSVLAFYSDKPIVGVDMWCIKGVPNDVAKILALWFNSTINLLQVYILRALDTWMKIHDYTFSEFFTLDLTRLTADRKEELLNLFNEIGTAKLPSILEQLRQQHPIRRKIDATLLKILGFKDEEIDPLLAQLYPLLANEIQRLKVFMTLK